MNAQQKQQLSWSDFYSEVIGDAKGGQKALIKSKANDIWQAYKSGMTAKETISYIIGGCL